MIPRRPISPIFPRNPLRHSPIKQNKQNFMSYFRTSEGNLDFIKIAGTAQQAKKMFDQVSPLITKFLKK
ncbi:YppG family protein [Thermaerobacillus caldiproteolyticus]|uniref:YppG family protein n=1 Tax=Thermaerobacillus caldiproteolyticus TaxID=247480 RepID=UPI0018F2443E